MRCIMRNMAFLAVAVLYIVSTMGYGVHRCSIDGTASLILLFGEAPCEFVHSHMDADGSCYTHSHAPGEQHHSDDCDSHHHSDDCCSTNVYVLTEDQNISIQDNSFVPDYQIIDAAPALQVQVLASVASVFRQTSHYLKVFPYLEQAQASLCTFRI